MQTDKDSKTVAAVLGKVKWQDLHTRRSNDIEKKKKNLRAAAERILLRGYNEKRLRIHSNVDASTIRDQ